MMGEIASIASRLWQVSPAEIGWGLASSPVVCAAGAVVLALIVARVRRRPGGASAAGADRERVALGALALMVGAAWLADVVLRGYVFDMSATVSWWRFAVAPLVATGGLVVLGASLRAGGARRAVDALSVTRRTWTTFGPRRELVALVTLAALTGAIVVVFGTTAMSLDSGVSAHVALDAPNTAYAPVVLPFPGWAYGIPTISALMLVIAATVFALHRNSVRPFRGGLGWDEERSRRAMTARGLVAVALAATLLALAGLLRMARAAVLTSMTFAHSGETVNVSVPHEDLIVLGGMLAPVLEISGAVVLALLVIRAGELVAPGRRLARTAGSAA
ncbi:hypothetical protein [Microbacterium sp. NPDC089184]|uniref:hypothetical protein n=2 Tax=Microbacterium TaxID=33882 RepID=UPI00341FCC67